jgi:hypothetical protein
MPSLSRRYDSRNAPGSVVASAAMRAANWFSPARVVSSLWLGD